MLRRASYQQHLENQVAIQAETIQHIRDKEETKRKAFYQNYGNVFLAKIFPEFADDSSKYSPACSMALSGVDPTLSQVTRYLHGENDHYKAIFDSQLYASCASISLILKDSTRRGQTEKTRERERRYARSYSCLKEEVCAQLFQC